MKRYYLKQWSGLVIALYILMGLTPSVLGGSTKGEKVIVVSPDKAVSIEYTLKLDDQTVVDSNVGADPFTYIHGSHQIVPGLEKALEGMKIGDRREVTVKPEEGYGPVDKNALIEVRKEQISPDAMTIGTQLQGRDQSGKAFTARIAEIKEDTVVLDFNHPLAGKILYFDVKVLNIQEVKKP